jgi:PilZ domain
MTNQRHHFRMPVARRGLVTHGQTTALCEVIDITEQGLHFFTELPLTVTETVRIECQLDEDCVVQCELLITHARPPRFGGKMTHLLPEHQQQLASFIQRLIISNMAGL